MKYIYILHPPIRYFFMAKESVNKSGKGRISGEKQENEGGCTLFYDIIIY